MDSILLDYKRIATRFLIDTNLYPLWKKYITKKGQINTWYRVKTIDTIFGQTLFTKFIREAVGKHPIISISDTFRFYVRFMYKDKYVLKLPVSGRAEKLYWPNYYNNNFSIIFE